jgi:hypothetical protein
MAEDPKKRIQDVNKELGFLEDQLLSIADRLSSTIKDAITDIKDEAAGVNEIFGRNLSKSIKDIARESDKILSNTLKLSQGSAKLADIKKSEYNIQLKQLAAQRNLDTLYDAGLLKKKQKRKAEAEIAEAVETQNALLKDQLTYASKIQKNLGITGNILKGINKIPILGNFLDAENALAKAQVEAAKEGATRTKVLGSAFSSLGSNLKENLSDPLTYIGLAATAFKKLIDLGLTFSQRTADIARNMGITTQQAQAYNEALYTSFKLSKEQSATVKAFAESNQNINDYLGTSVVFSEQILSTQTALVKRAGLTNEEAARFAELSFVTGKTQEEIYDTIGAQNKGILSNRKVLGQVLKVSGQLSAQYKNNPILLAQAVTQANKLGLTLEQTQNISKGLLNFEDSISAELEAELLTGKNLNLEKARYLALQGKSAEAAEEIAKQIGSAAEFSSMNVIKQEALAKAAGMSTDELADSLVKREAISKLQSEEFRKNGIMLTSEQAATKLKDQQLSASEKLAASTESLKDTLASIVAGPLGMMLDKVTSLFNLIAKSDVAKAVLGTAGGIAAAIAAVSTAVLVGKGIINSSKNRPTGNNGDPIHAVVDNGGGGTGSSVSNTSGGGGLGGNLKRVGKAYKGGGMRGAAKSLGRLGKGALKGGLKGIPMAGALLSAGLEFADGGLTWESAGRAAASGIGSFAGGALGSLVAPGVGTFAGGVAGGMAGDALGDLIFGEREELAKGGIVNKPTRALVGEAGPEAVIPLDKLMAEFREMRAVLTQIANKEGIVYLDGAKVGSAMGMRAYKTQ